MTDRSEPPDLPPLPRPGELPGLPPMPEDDEPRRSRSPRPRPRGPRKVTLALAVLIAAVAMLVGVALGYTARGGAPAPPLETLERELPIVTVTPGE